MTPSFARLWMFAEILAFCLGFPAIAAAWPSSSENLAGTSKEESKTSNDSANDEVALQEKTTPKPNAPANSPPKPTAPAAAPQRPTNRPSTQPALRQPSPATSQPTVPPQPAPQPQFNPFANPQPFAANNQPYLARLSRAPDMFGDFLQTENVQIATGSVAAGTPSGVLQVPIAGGTQRFKNEYSRALPTDRVFGFYNHFENAAQSSPVTPGFQTTSANVDRFIMGFEKTFLEGNTSIELRLPLSVPVSFASPTANYQTGTLGNLVVNLKGLLYSDESQAVSAGLAVNTPTGNDLSVSLADSSTSSFTIQNNAVHLIPYVAYQAAPTDDFFFNGFLQFDTPTNANNVQVVTGKDAARTTENKTWSDQTLLYLDTSFGYWFYRDPEADFFNGLAGLMEVHYTTALNNADVVASANRSVIFGANTGRLDTVNMAFGVHTQFARSSILRAAYIVPLRDGNHRFFDGEFTVGVIFRR